VKIYELEKGVYIFEIYLIVLFCIFIILAVCVTFSNFDIASLLFTVCILWLVLLLFRSVKMIEACKYSRLIVYEETRQFRLENRKETTENYSLMDIKKVSIKVGNPFGVEYNPWDSQLWHCQISIIKIEMNDGKILDVAITGRKEDLYPEFHEWL